jgi:hypothetical protein
LIGHPGVAAPPVAVWQFDGVGVGVDEDDGERIVPAAGEYPITRTE